MVQGYYTLPEAAQFLGVSVEELKQLAQKGKIRSFQDRGTLRFRIQDIQEVARARGGASDPELVLGDASLPPAPKSAAPSSNPRKSQLAPKTPAKQEAAPDVFEFAFDNEDNVDLGADFLSPKSKAASKAGKKHATPANPPAGSDSDVRLVSDGDDVTFSVAKDSDIKLADSTIRPSLDPIKPKTNMQASAVSKKSSSQLSLGSGVQQPSKTGLSGRKQQASPKPNPLPQPPDSGVRLVPMDNDSDVKILGASDEVPLGMSAPAAHGDSNVRLDRVELPPADSGEGGLMMTEEINLDEEIRKQEERDQKKAPPKLKAKSEVKFPTTSPFELSDSEMQMPSELLGDDGPKTPVQKKARDDDSSDFEIASQGLDDEEGGMGGGDFSLLVEDEPPAPPDNDDFSLEIPDEQLLQQDAPAELTSATSGISLSNPVDAGISLEENSGQANEEVDFDLSLDVGDTPRPVESSPIGDDDSDFQLKVGDTPRPVESSPADDSDSNFELTANAEAEAQTGGIGDSDIDLSLELDPEQPQAQAPQEDDSEFELNLSDEGDLGGKPDSDSEFELTLDDSGNIASLEADEEPAPQVKSKKRAVTKAVSKPAPKSDEEQDIFETDFDVPALDDSDDGAVADSELESSDFDLALDDSELASEEESGSQVVALDEEDAETIADSDGDAAVVDDIEVEEESSDFADMDADVQAEGDDVEVETDDEATGEVQTVVKERLIPAAPWGVMPVVFMLPCVVIMFLVGILGFEMMQTTTGLKPPGPLTLAIADMIGQPITLKK